MRLTSRGAFIFLVMLAASLPALNSCGNSGGGDGVTREGVVAQYAVVVHANYLDALTGAKRLQAAIDEFVAAPTEASHIAAKQAWVTSRESYSQSEAFRFYGGPIDSDTGPEGRINAWPLDEAYVDYVEGNANAGIINKTDIPITKERLAGLNEGGEDDILGVGSNFDAEKAIATGYHAIEFLLWGQDRFADSAGRRSYRDFLTTGEATAPNGERRGTYLKVAAALLVDDLQGLVTAWDPAVAGNYREAWLAQPVEVSLKNMIVAIGTLAKGELAAERIDVALKTKDQEDEHSCFSDTTTRDILMNVRGIENVYLGVYNSPMVASLSQLVRQINPALDDELRAMTQEALALATAIPAPFDQVIVNPDSDGYKTADALVVKLGAIGDKLVEVADALGLGVISVALPE